VTELKGARLRTALKGGACGVHGLLAVGEAAGTTYSFSGEGIARRWNPGILAAETAIGFIPRRPGTDDGRIYAQAMRQRFPPFRGLQAAQRWLSYPAICNSSPRGPANGRFVRSQLSGMLSESSDRAACSPSPGSARACCDEPGNYRRMKGHCE